MATGISILMNAGVPPNHACLKHCRLGMLTSRFRLSFSSSDVAGVFSKRVFDTLSHADVLLRFVDIVRDMIIPDSHYAVAARKVGAV